MAGDVLYDHSMDDTSANSSSLNGTSLTPYWSQEFSITLAVILAAIWVLSFFGNLLVLAVIIRFRGMRTRTNLFIANLALVDFMTALTCMPFSFTTIVMGEWVFNETLCQINGFLMPTVFITSIHTLMYISLHKHFTITNPFKTVLTKRIVLVMIAASWLVALGLAVVDIYGLNQVEFKHYTSQCGPMYPKGIKGYLHNAIMTLTTYVIPIGVMVFSYARMFKEIMAYSKRLQRHSSVERQTILNAQKKAAVTLFIVVICFVLCWTPYLVYATYGSVVKDKSLIPKWLNPVCYWFGYLNSAVNPIIYGMRNKSFSTGYRSIACSCCGQTNAPGTDEGSKVFTWSRKRSSVTAHDGNSPNGTYNGKGSLYKSDTNLPVVIRKNGKIIRIEEPRCSQGRLRGSSSAINGPNRNSNASGQVADNHPKTVCENNNTAETVIELACIDVTVGSSQSNGSGPKSSNSNGSVVSCEMKQQSDQSRDDSRVSASRETMELLDASSLEKLNDSQSNSQMISVPSNDSLLREGADGNGFLPRHSTPKRETKIAESVSRQR